MKPTEIDWSACSSAEREPERVSGAWLFCATRVPVAALLENLEDGVSVGAFCSTFPGVTQQQVRDVLRCAATLSDEG